MAEEISKTDAKLNGVGSHLAHLQLADGNPKGTEIGSKSGGSQHVAKDQNVSSNSSQKRTFKSVVQRHFVKDKLFVLVNELLKSVDEERQAQEDLIASFRTAREVTEPIRRRSVSATSYRAKRRRKRVDTPLLERITHIRAEFKEPAETVENDNKDVAAVGEMKITADEANESEFESENKSVIKGKGVSVKTSEKPEKSEEKIRIKNDIDNETVKYKHNGEVFENDIPKNRQRSKSLPASEMEKLSAIYELHRDKNTSEVDKLVLDSITENNTCETADTENSKDKVNKENIDETGLENEEKTTSELTVAVESNTESEDDDETNIKVIGTNDEMEEDYSDEDIRDFDNEDEIKKIKNSNLNVSTTEYNRIPASLHPNLDPIAEASSESFKSLPLSSRTSSSIIEIEAKQSVLPVQSDGNLNAHNGLINTDAENSPLPLLVGDNLFSNNGKVGTNGIENQDCGQISKGRDSNGDIFNATDIRSDIWVVDCKEKKISHVRSKTKKHTNQTDERRTKSAQYRHTGKLYDTELNGEKFDTQLSNERSQRNPRSSTRKKNDRDKEPSYRSTHDKKNVRNESEHRSKSRSNRRISLDLLGVYDDNTDLQRVSKSEIEPKQTTTSKGKSPPSPSRTRSKSPTKKRSRERKKYETKPLPPKMNSNSHSHSRNNPSLILFRSKTELSSRSSSTSSFEDMKESYKNLQSLKDDRRYKRPDSVLWERLDLSEGSTNNRKEGIKWSDDLGYEVKHKYSGLIELNSARNDIDTDGRRVTWNVPLNEAIKSITSSKNVPDITKLSKTVPREERVGRLYIDLKQERRASGYMEYRRLHTPDPKDELDEFTHL